jgi:hypothetical protein
MAGLDRVTIHNLAEKLASSRKRLRKINPVGTTLACQPGAPEMRLSCSSGTIRELAGQGTHPYLG